VSSNHFCSDPLDAILSLTLRCGHTSQFNSRTTMISEDSSRINEEDLEDWVLVGSDWWQQAYADVDWSCIRRYHWTDAGVKLTFHPRPLQYHSMLYNDKSQYGSSDALRRDLELSYSLIGVKGAEDTLDEYEQNVGIRDVSIPLPELFFTTQLSFLENTAEDVIRRSQKQWEHHVNALLGDILEPSCFDLPPSSLDDTVTVWDLDAIDDPCYDSDSHMLTYADVIDLSYSDTSVDSDPLPTTPQGDKKSYAEVLFDDRGTPTHAETVVSPSPSKPLNAFALAFIPGYVLDHAPPSPLLPDMPYVSPTYEFHFPSLNGHTGSRDNTRSLPPPLQRDENGFYNEVPSATLQTVAHSRSVTPKRSSGGSAPSLGITPRQTSKTREMVDRLKSNHAGSSRRHRRNKGENSSLRHSTEAAIPQTEKDSEGWIMGVESIPKRHKAHKSEDWVQGLFQCRQQTKQQKTQQIHVRSTSTATNASTTQTPPTPSSVSSTLSTLPSPTSPTFSHPRTPSAQFSLPPYFAFQPPFAAYPGPYPIPAQGPPVQMVHAPWPMVPAHAAYVMPSPIYGPSASPYDTRKAAPVDGARHA
jgi:hypothetical protein